jgi:hypothetical protein
MKFQCCLADQATRLNPKNGKKIIPKTLRLSALSGLVFPFLEKTIARLFISFHESGTVFFPVIYI